MTHDSAITSSSKSGASLPSVINRSSSAVMFLLYSSLACSGIVAGRFKRRGDGDAVFDDGLARLGELAVAPGLAGQVDHHAAGLHRFHRGRGHQTWCGPARNQRRGDHDVESADRLFQCLLLLGALLVGQLAGVPALAGRVDADIEPLRPHRTHLVGHLGADVVARCAAPQPLGRGQRLQPGHADPEHQHRGRLHRSRRRRQHREEPRRLRRRQQHGLIAGDVGL